MAVRQRNLLLTIFIICGILALLIDSAYPKAVKKEKKKKEKKNCLGFDLEEYVDFDFLLKALKVEYKVCLNPGLTSKTQEMELAKCAEDHPCRNCKDGFTHKIFRRFLQDGSFNCVSYVERQIFTMLGECCLTILHGAKHNDKLREINDCQLRAFNSTTPYYEHKDEYSGLVQLLRVGLESIFNIN